MIGRKLICHWRLVLLFGLASCAGQECYATPINLVQNGDFANGLQDWSTTGDVSASYGEGASFFEYIPLRGLPIVPTMAQTLQTVPGETYELQFIAWGLSNDPFNPTSALGFHCGDISGGLLATNGSSSQQDFIFTADSSTTLLRFDNGGQIEHEVFVDDVSVEAVPDNASTINLLIAGLGIVGFGFFRKFTRSPEERQS